MYSGAKIAKTLKQNQLYFQKGGFLRESQMSLIFHKMTSKSTMSALSSGQQARFMELVFDVLEVHFRLSDVPLSINGLAIGNISCHSNHST
jgi:hypothetical protein